MGELGKSLAEHRLIGIDTPIFVYNFEQNPRFQRSAAEVFREVLNNRLKGVTSMITLMELLVQPLQGGRSDVVQQYEALLSSLPNLRVLTIDHAAAKQAAVLRAAYQLRPADALQIATCIVNGATAFVTNDLRLRRVTAIEMLILEDFIDSAEIP